jgi:predicted SprT family Zn-dependent metalloprotease
MTEYDIETLARDLIRHWLGEGGWTFAWNNRKRTFGLCRYREKRIELSRVRMPSETREAIEQTILHEIAHALAGPEAKHGPDWKAAARRIGVINPRATRQATGEAQLNYRYAVVCEGKVLKRYLRHPGRAFQRSLPHRQLKGKPETLGRLKLVALA